MNTSDVSPPVIVVSGLPRSGTSLLMSMLAAGGIPLFADGLRSPDDNNPRGYFEYEPVKSLKSDSSWLPQVKGQAIKIISDLLACLPDGLEYKVIYMRREIREVMASQQRMLGRLGVQDTAPDTGLLNWFEHAMAQSLSEMRNRSNVELIEINYGATLRDPLPRIRQINEFLGGNLNTAAMETAIDPSLHRERTTP